MTPWEKLEKFPPVLVRLLAKDTQGRGLTDHEVAAASGLPVADVKRLSYLTSWDNVSNHDTRRFLSGCGCDLFTPRHYKTLSQYRRRTSKFVHLTRHANWHEFREMMRVLAAHLSRVNT
jgi:hypothetical protein